MSESPCYTCGVTRRVTTREGTVMAARMKTSAAASLPPFGILYFFTMRHDIFNLFISNSVASAVIYLFLRQFAIFESRYYHSISKSSVPLK